MLNIHILKKGFIISLISLLIYNNSFSQNLPVDSLKEDSIQIKAGKNIVQRQSSSGDYDFGDLYNDIFHPHRADTAKGQRSGITVIPNIAANPTIGFQLGIKAVAGLMLGQDPKTLMSVGATSASVTTKGILYFYLNHNVFTNANKYNLQGSIVLAKTLSPDYGLGMGYDEGLKRDDDVVTNPGRKPYVLHSLYINFREKVYKNVAPNLFTGAGVALDIRKNIQDKAHADTIRTPYYLYNKMYGFSNKSYSSNGFLFNIEYITRDNQNRPYKGVFADAGFRINQTWIGSSKNALVFTTDVRKYFSLSHHHPEHVIALWNWGSYLVSGALPYLELPGSGRDGSFRSARGYTSGYFKGTQYNYSEIEYRFPITNNRFLSGVAFFNMQTANNTVETKLFQQWRPGGGGGLRVLFNKATRTNLCLDYAFGTFGKKDFSWPERSVLKQVDLFNALHASS